MESHAHIFCRYQLYHLEERPRYKLTRMTRLFEVTLKYYYTVVIAEYFKFQQWNESDKELFMQSLHETKLSLWRIFGRELFFELTQANHSFLLPSFTTEFLAMEDYLNQSGGTVLSLVKSLENGMISSDNKSLNHIQNIYPHLEKMLHSKWMTESKLIVHHAKVSLATEKKELSLHPLLLYNTRKPPCNFVFFDDRGVSEVSEVLLL